MDTRLVNQTNDLDSEKFTTDVVRQLGDERSWGVQLPQLITQEYQWLAEENKRMAIEHLTAALISHRRGYEKQILLHQQEIIKYLTKDVAARAQAVTKRQTGYLGQLYYHPNKRVLPTQSFKVSIDSQFHWLYQKIVDFGGMVPPAALEALTQLERAHILPDDFWVADKKQQFSYQGWRSVDPLLCAQFHRWFVPIAEWK